MPRLRLLVVLGAVYFGFCFAFFYTLRQITTPQVFGRVQTDGANNDFVFRESQYCRPFLQSSNLQVVRITHQYRPRAQVQERVLGCSGVIVGERAVLTAKHCLDLDGGRLILGLVSTSLGESFEIKRSYTDPQEDIALLFVDKPLDIEPAPLATQVPLALTLEGWMLANPVSLAPASASDRACSTRSHPILGGVCLPRGQRWTHLRR